MKTSSRVALLAALVLLLAVLAPRLAWADAIPYPSPVTPAPTEATATAAETSRAAAEYWANRREQSSSSANLLFVIVGAMSFIGPLMITLLVEVPIIAIAASGTRGAWKSGVLINALTNPIAVLAVLLAAPLLVAQGSAIPLMVFVACVEVGVTLAEWRLLRWAIGMTSGRALATSVIANALSFGVGLVIVSAGFIW